jgi:FAD:protein FMN transferase
VAGRTTKALGTFCSVLVTRPKALDEAQQILVNQLAAIDLACSRFREDSELSALNRAGGQPVTVSPLFATALEVALRAAQITDGDVDPTCGRSLVHLGYDKDFAALASDTSALTQPPAPAAGWRCVQLNVQSRTVQVPTAVMLDLGATAKALAADLAAGAIFDQLGCGVLVNLGGDIAVAGQAPDGGWRVGVDDGVTSVDADPPLSPGSGGASSSRSSRRPGGRRAGSAQVVSIEAGGVATSGPAFRSWRRGGQAMHHIVVPSTGQPAEIYWAGVSVAAASCVDANTASTAAIVRGRSAPGWLSSMNLPARLIRPDAMVVTTGGWPR